MGISRDPPTLFMGDVPYQLNDVFHEFRKVKSKLKVSYIHLCWIRILLLAGFIDFRQAGSLAMGTRKLQATLVLFR